MVGHDAETKGVGRGTEGEKDAAGVDSVIAPSQKLFSGATYRIQSTEYKLFVTVDRAINALLFSLTCLFCCRPLPRPRRQPQ